MQAIIVLMERHKDGHLEGYGKLAQAKTKRDIKTTAKNLAAQNNARLTDIIFDDSPHWKDYLKNTIRNWPSDQQVRYLRDARIK